MKKLLLSLFILLLVVNNASAVIIDGNDWRQLNDTLNFSWQELDGIYDEQGELDTAITTLSGIDFEGWTWASAAEVSLMKYEITGLDTDEYTSTTSIGGSLWAPLFFDWFDPTQEELSGNRAYGWTRSVHPEGGVVQYGMSDNFDEALNDGSRWTRHESDYRNDLFGVFLYKEVAPVPEPATMLLFGLGLLGLAGVSRKKQ